MEEIKQTEVPIQEKTILDENDDGFTSIANNDPLKDLLDENNNLFKDLKLDDHEQEDEKSVTDKVECKEKRQNRAYFNRRLNNVNDSKNSQGSRENNKNNNYNKKYNFKSNLNIDTDTTPINDLKSRLDFRTRIPTIVDDLYLDPSRLPNRQNRGQNYNQNFNRQNGKKNDNKPFNNEKMVITRDFQNTGRQVNYYGNNKKNNQFSNDRKKEEKEVQMKKHEKIPSHNLTPPPTPVQTSSSSKIAPPPGLAFPDGQNERFADKEYAAAIAAFLMSNQIFAPIQGASLTHLSDTHLDNQFNSL
ncbi:unnamed protein product [Brachionus calyciflorus]|uniref:Uncharacterized protein n=1 Tax=Brachionus calyciflorus TaxID=104777 RepID=A0A814CC88_9BILA|nr:unnamed protein product [Brachionus calyciflorus]